MWEVLVFCFNWKKSTAEAHRMLVEVYGDNAPTDKSCRECFRRFKNGEFSIEDKPRCGQPKKFEDTELEALLDEGPTQTQRACRYIGSCSSSSFRTIKIHGNDSKARQLGSVRVEVEKLRKLVFATRHSVASC